MTKDTFEKMTEEELFEETVFGEPIPLSEYRLKIQKHLENIEKTKKGDNMS